MPDDVRLWAVREGDSLVEISRTRLDLEARIENWIKLDASVLLPDLLVIGNQVETDYGGYVDLLCIDSDGNLVVVELKRDKTPRDITAQTLDYASWVKDLSMDRITDIASKYLGSTGSLESAFKARFGTDLPEVVNESHSLLIVASEIDASSERIINYLSDTYGVDINAVTFQYFRDQAGQEYLARTFLVAPDEVQQRASSKGNSKRTAPSSETIQRLADAHGVGELYRTLTTALGQYAYVARRKASVTIAGRTDGSPLALVSLLPGQSDTARGLRYQVYTERLAEYSGVPHEKVIELLPQGHEPHAYYPNAPSELTGRTGFFRTEQDASRFLAGITGTPAMKLRMHRKSELSAGQKAAENMKAKAVEG
jgi:hypothetical protein